MAQAASLKVYLEAGYKDFIGTLFLGDVRSVTTKIQGPDVVTSFSSGDGSKAIRGKRVAVTFGSSVTVPTVLDHLAQTLGVKPGNLAQAKQALATEGLATLFPKGLSLYGNAWRQTQEFARSAGLEISIQDDALQILRPGAALTNRAYLLTPDTGLLGSPSVDADGTVSFEALLIPDLRPGTKVQLDTDGVKGFYRVTHSEYRGNTAPGSTVWGVSCHAAPLTA